MPEQMSDLTNQLIAVAAKVVRGVYTIEIDQCRTIQDARRAHDVQDSKRVQLGAELKKLVELSQRLAQVGREAGSSKPRCPKCKYLSFVVNNDFSICSHLSCRYEGKTDEFFASQPSQEGWVSVSAEQKPKPVELDKKET